VNKVQGKKVRSDFSLNINGNIETDKGILASTVANFFEAKILNLTGGLPAIEKPWKNHIFSKMHSFTEPEILKALDLCKPKMSKGVDEIPMRLIRTIGKHSPSMLVRIFNRIAASGFPEEWKMARVVPVPKKGDTTEVKNYRPVSNLCSLSKVYERCILNRIMDLENIDILIGVHQHGFRKSHSTVTCALELKDKILEYIDKKEHVLVYSLDMTAAFDML